MSTPLPFSDRIKFPLAMKFKEDTVRLSYGGGFSQRLAKGANNLTGTADITWTNLSTAQMKTLVAAIEGAKGVEVFSWTPPTHSTPKAWSIAQHGPTQIAQDAWEYNATLVLEYDPL